MTDMPINSKPQLSGNAPGALFANIASENPATGMPPAEPFAFLLAQQIGEVGSPALDITLPAPPAGASEAGDSSQMDVQADATATMNDMTSLLSSIMAQIPAEPGKAPPPQPGLHSIAPGSSTETRGIQAALPSVAVSAHENEHQKTVVILNENQKTAIIPGDPKSTPLPPFFHQAQDTIGQLDMAPTQPAHNITQTISAPAMPATTMPGSSSLPQAPITQTITAPLNSHEWGDEFAQKISWISTQGHQIAELRLNPPNLGPLDIVLKISDNQATALFTSPHGAVRDAVESALPKLREILADNGIMLGNATVSDQPPRDRSNADGSMSEWLGRAKQPEDSSGTTPKTDEETPIKGVLARRHNGMVDTFA